MYKIRALSHTARQLFICIICEMYENQFVTFLFIVFISITPRKTVGLLFISQNVSEAEAERGFSVMKEMRPKPPDGRYLAMCTSKTSYE